jgi:hypothetical protein
MGKEPRHQEGLKLNLTFARNTLMRVWYIGVLLPSKQL